jgi:hypothetical protein
MLLEDSNLFDSVVLTIINQNRQTDAGSMGQVFFANLLLFSHSESNLTNILRVDGSRFFG